MRSLDGRCALVTGASQGIGRAIAIALGRAGADVVAAARGASGDGHRALSSLEAEIRALGARAVGLKGDVSREGDVETIVDRALAEFGRIDVLVNNAAVYPDYHAPLADLPIASWDETLAVNLRGVFLCAKAVLPSMRAQKAGSIVNVSSIAAIRSSAGRIAYGVSKAGVERLTFGLAAEVEDVNVAVNALAPVGPTDTPSARAMFPREPRDRWVKPDDLAAVAVWLAQQTAATFTGKAVMVPASGTRTFFVYGQGDAERPWVRID
ncbi:MAG: SDR family oxidoreductase [Candidatus Rokubacteria bacterium]|nr:SDR family oxidoreductase [Candidatus Rokubacteria bacterium]